LNALIAVLGTINSGGIDDGFVEFGDVGLCDCGVNGVWNFGGLWDSARWFRVAATAKAACTGEGSSGSGARALILRQIVRYFGEQTFKI
jgi:hypothetical protein